MVREPVPEITIGGQKLGPYKPGEKIVLSNWIIEELQAHNLVTLAPEDAYESMRRLQNLSREEEKQPHKLQSFHPFLYSALSRKMFRLQSDKTSLDPRRYEEIEKMQRMIPVLIETRLSKVVRVAKSGASQDKRRQMTNEERWLCDELVGLFSAWRSKLLD
jgi:DNA replication initiation complex subunit (GINS family)